MNQNCLFLVNIHSFPESRKFYWFFFRFCCWLQDAVLVKSLRRSSWYYLKYSRLKKKWTKFGKLPILLLYQLLSIIPVIYRYLPKFQNKPVRNADLNMQVLPQARPAYSLSLSLACASICRSCLEYRGLHPDIRGKTFIFRSCIEYRRLHLTTRNLWRASIFETRPGYPVHDLHIGSYMEEFEA